MAIYPGAVIKNVPRFVTRMRPVRVNLHTAVSNASTLYGYFAQAGQVCSHFYVRADGTVEQYVDTAYRAAADLQGNPDTISIETWDGYGSTWVQGQAVPAWTDAQVVALRSLVDWIIDTHPSIPRRIATDSKAGDSSHGVSWHLLGVPATYAQLNAGISQTGGMLYTRKVGKICPGPKRIAQIPSLLATSGGIGGGMSPVVVPTPAPAPPKAPSLFPLLVDGDWGSVTTKGLQTRLGGLLVDGDFGLLTVKALQRKLGGLYVDGDFGPLTIKALQRRLGVTADGWFGPVSVRALQHRLNEGNL